MAGSRCASVLAGALGASAAVTGQLPACAGGPCSACLGCVGAGAGLALALIAGCVFRGRDEPNEEARAGPGARGQG
jgi:hypothetical protein